MRRITCLTDCELALFCMLLGVPIASGQQTAPAVPEPAAYNVAVKMIDLVDSSSDPAGKQYRAGVVRPVAMGNWIIIAQGSAATVVLVRNGSGWSVQLSSLVIKNQVTTVTSNSGTVMGAAAQTNITNAANAASGALGGLHGRKPNSLPAVAAVATGERVVLTPGITLVFAVSQIPPSNAPAPGAVSAPVSSAANTVPAAPAQRPAAPAAQPAAQVNSSEVIPVGPSQALYFCNASVEAKPDTYYFSATFTGPKGMDGNLVGKDFGQFVKEKYSLQGNVLGGCSGADSVKDRDVQIDNARFLHHPFVDTGWKPTKAMPINNRR